MEAINLRTGESLWTRSAVGDGAGIFATTIRALKVDQSNVYIETGREPVISAFNLQNGTLRWKFEAPPSTGFVSLQGQNGKLYVFVSSDLYILDAPTGQVEKHIVGQFGDGGAPIVSGQNVYLSYLGGLTAKDAQTGKLRWQFEPSCTSASINALRPTIIGNRVYAGSSCRMLYALDSSSGRLLWQKALSADSVPNLVAIGPVAYVMLRDGTLDAFDLNTGADAGKLETTPPSVANGLFTEGLATDGNSLFVTFGDRQLFAFGE
jgi:outer membrane protein assembly factor BamB